MVGADPVGFAYCLPDAGEGLIVTTTDQDYLRSVNINATTQAFMRNVITRLAHAPLCN